MQVDVSGFVPVLRKDSSEVAPGNRLDWWRSLIGDTYALESPREGFEGALSIAAVDRMVVQQMDATPQGVARSARQIRRDGLEHIVLHLNMHGYAFAVAAGEDRLAPGEISINDLARPFQRGVASDRGSVLVSLSRTLVESVCPDRDCLHGTVLSGPSGALFAEHMRMLSARMAELPAAAARPLAEATAAMLAASLAPKGDVLARGQAPLQAARSLCAKRYIRAHLHRPGLDPQAIARALHMSRSKLFALFESEGGVERYLRNRRLAAVADALRDPRETRPVAALAYANGFTSAQSFARAFRERYGMSASDMRSGGARPASGGAEAGRSAFTAWLKALG